MDWNARLAELAEQAEVPGAVLGILADGTETIASHGVLSTATGVEVTGDSVFQVGSITKVWTATMIMQLADERRLTLDSTVADLLPGVRIGRDDGAAEVTVRHLLTHSSGIDGDIFTDTGRGDECYQRYVGLLADTARPFPPGAGYSYCNSGFVLLGRIIGVLDGRTWDESLRARLGEPLGLTRTATLPEEAILHRAAVGHQQHARPVRAVDTWHLPRSINPAGGITQSAGDLLAFVRHHLGTEGLAAMRAEQVRLPPGTPSGDAMGLGWRVFEWDARRLVGHDGSTVGQTAYLRVDPDTGFAFCLLTNSPQGPALYRALGSEVVREYLGVAIPPPPAPAEHVEPRDPARHLGRYEMSGRELDVAMHDGGLRLTWTVIGELAAVTPEPVQVFDLVPADASGDRFVFKEHPDLPWVPLTFASFADGTPYLFCGGRATPKST
jgi:CubicO group peptidase (beta-lactamase class C family)